jgi:hypothetical protein
MTARVSVGITSRTAHLRRLAVLFAIELRLKIVTELYMRPMGPSQFYKEFGGGSVPRVARQFKELRKHGWLRYVRSGRSASGKLEGIYRAPELAYFDSETWALLPYSIRVAFSWNSFSQIAEHMRAGIESTVSEGRSIRDLTFTQLQLDPIGWKRVIDAFDTQFVSVFEEQKDALLRVSHTGEELMRASILHIAFESAVGGDASITSDLVEIETEPMTPFPERLFPVFDDETCMQIVAETNHRRLSATQFRREFGGQPTRVYRRFKRMRDYGWLGKVGEEKRRGATEIFYRATRPTFCDSGFWSEVSDLVGRTKNWKTLVRLSASIKAAMKAGTFDSHADRYLALSFVQLDQQGWERVVAELDALLAYALEEQERAKDRMKKVGEKQVTMMVALGAFESPKESVKAP